MKCDTGLQHDQHHALLRIFDDVEEEEAVTNEVERYYNRAKVAFSEELATLETKFTQRMDALAAQVDKIQQGAVASQPATTTPHDGTSTHPSAAPKDESGTEGVEGASLSALSSRMERLEKDVSSRFTALEALLVRVLEAIEARR